MNDFRGADTSQQDDDGISPESASLSYHPCLRLTQIGDFWSLFGRLVDRCQRFSSFE